MADSGMVSAEAAMAIGSLVLVLGLLLQVFVVVFAHLRAGDAARTAARLVARGDGTDLARAAALRSDPGAEIGFERRADEVRVAVSAQVVLPLLRWVSVPVRADAVAAVERPDLVP